MRHIYTTPCTTQVQLDTDSILQGEIIGGSGDREHGGYQESARAPQRILLPQM